MMTETPKHFLPMYRSASIWCFLNSSNFSYGDMMDYHKAVPLYSVLWQHLMKQVARITNLVLQ